MIFDLIGVSVEFSRCYSLLALQFFEFFIAPTRPTAIFDTLGHTP
jgi:hypothetical protein